MNQPELACVVLALGNPPELVDAVRSLLGAARGEIGSGEPGQPRPAPMLELVVVNSGGGGAARALAAAGIDGARVAVVEREERLFAGAARNLGIATTRAPFVAFLAADCWAEPGWVEARLAAHRAGAEAVASAVTNPYRRNLAAWTSYVALFHRRMPGAAPRSALRYGVSYARPLFSRFGLFREDLRTAEDTEFHRRLEGRVELAWVPAVRTAHRHPRRLSDLFRDQLRRGERSARAWSNLAGPGARTVALDALRRAPESLRAALRAAEAGELPWILGTGALLPFAALAYAWGALRAGDRMDEDS